MASKVSLSGKEGKLSGGKDPALAGLRERIRHSASHIMAEAVRFYFPTVKLAIGPPTDDGFYYDFELPRHLTPEDLANIEAKMKETIAANVPFAFTEVSRDEARKLFASQPYKLQLIESIPADEKLSLYTHGEFTDLCEGPHVARSGDVKAVKLLTIAGAYWRGDERNPMLQRIYGTAFEGQEALDKHLKMLEEAAKRDHRKLGRELELFQFEQVAPAMPFFLPKGAAIYNRLVDYIRGLYRRYGYEEVITPQVFSVDLWRTSGHYDNYRENMFFVDIDERQFAVKPMNCPSHVLIFKSKLRSYRDLPIRIADFGRLHRYERSGVTHGLARVRSFSQDDAHIFCRPDQINQEVASFIEMLLETYRLFGFQDLTIYLSLRPDKRTGSDELWDRAEGALTEALHATGVEFTLQPGEGAFYGPKIDFIVHDAIGREWQLGTAQLDFNLPERFGLEYIAEDGSAARPVMVHRALLGSVERFIGILVEHTAGAFPVWLAPVQALVIPIADRHNDYARQVAGELEAAGITVKVNDRKERMQAKIRDAQMQKVPYMLVVGDKEAQHRAVAVRLRSGEDLGAKPLAEITERIRNEIAERK